MRLTIRPCQLWYLIHLLRLNWLKRACVSIIANRANLALNLSAYRALDTSALFWRLHGLDGGSAFAKPRRLPGSRFRFSTSQSVAKIRAA